MTRRAGVTLIEVMVASGLLGGLMVLALTAVTFTARPAAETAIRAHLVTQGGQVMARLVAELEGGRFFPSPFVGALGAEGFAPDRDGDGIGTAVQGQRILGWDPLREDFLLEKDEHEAPAPFTWAFVPAGPDALALVRAQRGLVVTALTDVEAGTAGFRFAPPSALVIGFTVRRAIGVDVRTGAQRFTRARFEQTINLRDKNQR